MKQSLYFMCFVVLFYHGAMGQRADLSARYLCEQNIKSLTDSKVLLRRISIDGSGVALFASDDLIHPEFRVYWDEVGNFLKVLEDKDYYTIQKMYQSKRSARFSKAGLMTHSIRGVLPLPTDLRGLRVALDPGHFGGDMAEARLEGRMVKIKGADLGLSEDVSFFEADLTFATALILKGKLEERGAQVMITRPYGAGALDLSFSAWLRTAFERDVNKSRKLGDIAQSFYDSLIKAYNDTTQAPNRYYLFQFYKYLDFRARAERINSFKPAISLIIHYNAVEGGRQYGKDRYTMPTSSNFSMAFVPGSFEADELLKPDQKVDFIRLLLSNDLSHSIRLANLLVQKHHEILGVAPIPFDSLKWMKQVVVPTPHQGVFCRNLYLTRAIRGPVVYSESLYQDNILEAVALSRKDFDVLDETTGTIYKTSSRCELVAEAHFQAILEFLNQNKELGRIYSPDSALLEKN